MGIFTESGEIPEDTWNQHRLQNIKQMSEPFVNTKVHDQLVSNVTEEYVFVEK